MIDLEPQIRFMIDHGSGDLFIYKMNLALYTYLLLSAIKIYLISMNQNFNLTLVNDFNNLYTAILIFLHKACCCVMFGMAPLFRYCNDMTYRELTLLQGSILSSQIFLAMNQSCLSLVEVNQLGKSQNKVVPYIG